jgi:lipopolysaccharide/colanic/teichoic acid biosynthesis glycosyltransferase
MIKRLTDIIGAVLVLPLLIFIWIPVAVAIFIDSNGPILFRQVRVGLNERPFTILKFRTMRFDMDDRASHEASKFMITRVGRILRLTKIDELPQILNVLAGSMSFVGPRPCLYSQNLLIELRRQKNVFQCRPGITGIAQLRGVDMSNPEKLSTIDAEYCQNRSDCNDILIILRTVVGQGRGDAVQA